MPRWCHARKPILFGWLIYMRMKFGGRSFYLKIKSSTFVRLLLQQSRCPTMHSENRLWLPSALPTEMHFTAHCTVHLVRVPNLYFGSIQYSWRTCLLCTALGWICNAFVLHPCQRYMWAYWRTELLPVMKIYKWGLLRKKVQPWLALNKDP